MKPYSESQKSLIRELIQNGNLVSVLADVYSISKASIYKWLREQNIKPVESRGFASMTTEKQQQVARLGGLAIASIEGRMSTLGRKGGFSISKNKEWMKHIGKLGAISRKKKKKKS